MNSLSSFTLYIILATIVPGFITISLLLGIYLSFYGCLPVFLANANVALGTIVVLAVAFLTQLAGMVLEKLLFKLKFFPDTDLFVNLPENNANPAINRQYKVNTLKTYHDMYVTMSMLGDKDDSHGHIQRIIGQFFLTNNTLVSVLIAAGFTIWCFVTSNYSQLSVFLGWLLLLSFFVTIVAIALQIRFKTMVKAVFTARHMCNLRGKF